jgi:hypothetical protein
MRPFRTKWLFLQSSGFDRGCLAGWGFGGILAAICGIGSEGKIKGSWGFP